VLKIAYQKTEHKGREIEAAKLLLLELSNLSSTDFYLSLDKIIPESTQLNYFGLLKRYLEDNEPIQHLLGYAYFYGRKFIVNRHVLIPRLETEQLLEHVLIAYDTYFSNQKISILDLGSGSGCIGISLKLEAPLTEVTLADISQDALDISKKNAEALGADLNFVCSDWFSSIEKTFDIIVSNPPYIPRDEIVDVMVSKEPSLALYGGTTFYDIILKNIKPYLKPRSLIAFEHGYQQKEAIRKIVESYHSEATIIQLKDLQGKDRFTLIGFMDVLAL